MQPNQRRLLSALILIIGLVWIQLSADRTASASAALIPGPLKGSQAPDFSLATPTGEKFSVRQLRGSAVLINIWATWCPPCRAEMPTIQKLYEEYQSRGLVVLGVNSTVQDYPLDIVPFVTQYGLTFPILLDETGDLGPKYDLTSLPTSYFIDRAGKVAERYIGGPMSEALLRTYIEEILKSVQN